MSALTLTLMPDADQQPRPSPELVARARAYREAGGSPAPAKASATVILLRDGREQLEVFMLRRHLGMLFAGGMYVFPGGVVDAADYVGRNDEEAHVFAAIRETFEECGVLLASSPATDVSALEADRVALIEHRATFDELLARHRAVAQPHLLRPWSRWVTPDFEPRRYDTHFYVAIAPALGDARFVGGEADAAQWVAPELALAAQESGRVAAHAAHGMDPSRADHVHFGSGRAGSERGPHPRAGAGAHRPGRRAAALGGHRTVTTSASSEQPTARTFLVRASNPSPMTLDGTNTWVLVAPGQTHAIVVDPGPDDASHRHAVMAALEAAGANQVALILLTHGHADHAAGAPALHQLIAAPTRAMAQVHCSAGSAAAGR